MRNLSILACALGIGLLAVHVQAGIIPVPNPSFESPSTDVYVGGIPDWTTSGGRDVGVCPVGVSGGAGGSMSTVPDGNQYAYTLCDRGNWSPTDIQSAVLGQIQAGDTYTLNVSVGTLGNKKDTAIGTVLIRLLGADTQDGAYAELASQAITPPAKDAWDSTQPLVYTAPAGDAGKYFKISLYWEYSGGNYQDSGIEWDNVQLISVPEPVTLAMLAVGGLAVLRRRRAA